MNCTSPPSALFLREPEEEILPGVRFGRPEWVPSPAFWVVLATQENARTDAYISLPGSPLVEDVAFCILGGYGIKMEVNRAAWERLKCEGLFEKYSLPRVDEIEALLRHPLRINGRSVRYRFPKQRAERLGYALNYMSCRCLPTEDPVALRAALLTLPGVGPKTASWIVRNWAGSDEVAILDVHVIRAGQMMGLFPKHIRLPRDYRALELRFLEFAQALRVRASLLDALIWREMRILTR